MSNRQRRISGLAFVAGVLAGLVLIGVGDGARARGQGLRSAGAQSLRPASTIPQDLRDTGVSDPSRSLASRLLPLRS